MEITFYYTGLHCTITPTMQQPSSGVSFNDYGNYAVLTLPETGDTANVIFTLTKDAGYNFNRDYVMIKRMTSTPVDITNSVYHPEDQTIRFNDCGNLFYDTFLIQVTAIYNKEYVSTYTGLDIDNGVLYTNQIKEDRDQVTDGKTFARAEQAKVNAAALEGYNSEYFCPADRITTKNSLGLIKQGSGFVLENDGTLNTDIKVQINHYTNTIDLFLNTSEE